MFSEPIHKLTGSLASLSSKKVYRYIQTLRNPFQGSLLHQIPGHHFIEALFLFQTLREKYPSQRLKDISEEYGKRWISFAAGEEPWEEYRLHGGVGDGKIMVINGRTGFEVRSRNDDEVESKIIEEGERRYAGWEVTREIMEALAKGDDSGRGENVRWNWGTDDGIFRLAGLKCPYENVLA